MVVVINHMEEVAIGHEEVVIDHMKVVINQ